MLRKTIASILVLAVICGGGIGTARADGLAAVEQARKAAEAWLKLVDDGKYRQSWDQAATLFKDHVTADRWEQMVGAVRKPLGAVISRTFKLAHYSTTLPGAPDGEYVVIQYDTSFENKKAAVETVTPMLDKDGQWRVSGYFIN
jgi:hypothetical protein